MNTSTSSERVTFARNLGCFDATMIGVGAMIGAGIFVLTGIAAGEAGPAAILAFGLNGLVTLLTAFCYAELSSAIPEAGGGYSYVKKAFPGPLGFLAGWMLWFAYTVACSLYALGFAGYFWEFFHKYAPGLSHIIQHWVGVYPSVALVTVLICAFFIWLNVHGTEGAGKAENIITLSKIAVLLIFVAYGVSHVVDTPASSFGNFLPFFPKGMGGVIVAMGLTFIAFEGYDLIATVAEEIKEPEKNIPRATFISLSLTVVVYLLILFVALGAVHPENGTSWEFLGAYQETAIVKAADSFMPAFGVATIVFGGLLSTMSALNATVLASSRVAFSMGRDRWLPIRVAEIHPVKRTPHVAILATGVIFLGIALLLPIQIVGSAASLMFLLTLDAAREYAQAHDVDVISDIRIAHRIEEGIISASNEERADLTVLGWKGFSTTRERIFGEIVDQVVQRVRGDMAVVRLRGEPPFKRILLPTSGGPHAEFATELIAPLVKAWNAQVTACYVVPSDADENVERDARSWIQRTLRNADLGEVEHRLIRSNAVADGIIHAAIDYDLVVIGAATTGLFQHLVFGEIPDRIGRYAPTSVMLVKRREGPTKAWLRRNIN